MDAVAYQMSFDKEQLALLCANYDRRIDSLGAEEKKLKAENAKLRSFAQRLYTYAMDEYPDGTELNFADEARELGVVADGQA